MRRARLALIAGLLVAGACGTGNDAGTTAAAPTGLVPELPTPIPVTDMTICEVLGSPIEFDPDVATDRERLVEVTVFFDRSTAMAAIEAARLEIIDGLRVQPRFVDRTTAYDEYLQSAPQTAGGEVVMLDDFRPSLRVAIPPGRPVTAMTELADEFSGAADVAVSEEFYPELELSTLWYLLQLWYPRPFDAVVFFTPRRVVEPADAQHVLAALGDTVTASAFYSPELAYVEAQDVFESIQVGDLIAADDLPASLRLQLAGPLPAALDLTELDHVDSVVEPQADLRVGLPLLLISEQVDALLASEEPALADNVDQLVGSLIAWRAVGVNATRGSVFTEGERELFITAAREVATYARARCGLRLPDGEL